MIRGILALKEELDKIRMTDAPDCQRLDFFQHLPPELTKNVLTYLSEKDLFSCARCSLTWRDTVNDNYQWKLRCVRRGWAKATSLECPQLPPSHVSPKDAYRFRKSPVFMLMEVASLRISPLCEWALCFRQFLHLENNWRNGHYVVKKLCVSSGKERDSDPDSFLYNCYDFDGSLLACGTSNGKVFLWSTQGVPEYLTCVESQRPLEVKNVRLKEGYLVIQYQHWMIKVYTILKNESEENHTANNSYTFNFQYQMQGIVTASQDGFENNLDVRSVNEGEVPNNVNATEVVEVEGEEGDHDVVEWIRNLFGLGGWMNDDHEDTVSDDDILNVYANNQVLILTAIWSKRFFVWDTGHESSLRQFQLPHNCKVTYECHLSQTKFYVCVNKQNTGGVDDNGGMSPGHYIFVYNVSCLNPGASSSSTPGVQVFQPTPAHAIRTEAIVEEIMPTDGDARIAFSTETGSIHGVQWDESLNDYVPLFNFRAPTVFVDNLIVSDRGVFYHEFDGALVGLDWEGSLLYRADAHMGLIKGLKAHRHYLVSGGGAMELFVWDATDGTKLHTVYHQPCRIQNVFVDTTKIITVGREDPPVVIAYW